MKAPFKFYQGERVRFKPPDREWLHHQYWELGKSLVQIGREQDCTHIAVNWWMKKVGIRRRNKQECAERHSERMSGAGNPAWNGGTSRNYQRRALTHSGRPHQCEWCGHVEKLHVHHRDNDVTNGSLENLAWMCYNCNLLEAHLRGLQQRGRADILIEANQITIRFNT